MSITAEADSGLRSLMCAAEEMLKWPAQAGVLVVGSRAEAVSQSSSNANVLVLGAPPSWVAGLRDRGVIVRPMTMLDNVIVQIDRTEVSLDVVGEAARDRLAAVMASVVVLDDPANETLELPTLDIFELRLMARLRSGVVLQSADVVRQWRSVLQVDRFRSYYAVCTYLVAQHYIGKSQASAAEGDLLGAVLRSNTAAEHLAYSAMAIYGHLLHESKNLGRHVAAVLDRESDTPAVLRQLGGLLTTGFDWIGSRSQTLRAWSAELLTAMSADPSLADAHAFLTGAGR